MNAIPLAKPPAAEIIPIVEDYSDLATEEDDIALQSKVADFKMKNSFRRGLFHPDDIKTFGLGSLNSSPPPMTAPLPELARKRSRPSLAPIAPGSSLMFGGPQSASSTSLRSGSGGHVRSASFVGPFSASSPGSVGRAEARRMLSATEFDKYTEGDDEDYEDVFGKPNGTSESEFLLSVV